MILFMMTSIYKNSTRTRGVKRDKEICVWYKENIIPLLFYYISLVYKSFINVIIMKQKVLQVGISIVYTQISIVLWWRIESKSKVKLYKKMSFFLCMQSSTYNKGTDQ